CHSFALHWLYLERVHGERVLVQEASGGQGRQHGPKHGSPQLRCVCACAVHSEGSVFNKHKLCSRV
ncbi:hypothetical protein HDU98_001746, partial [Podochytrium sp. JEL0797]